MHSIQLSVLSCVYLSASEYNLPMTFTSYPIIQYLCIYVLHRCIYKFIYLWMYLSKISIYLYIYIYPSISSFIFQSTFLSFDEVRFVPDRKIQLVTRRWFYRKIWKNIKYGHQDVIMWAFLDLNHLYYWHLTLPIRITSRSVCPSVPNSLYYS